MGQAARRKTEIAALKSRNTEWFATLSPEEKIIAEVAQKTYDKVVCELRMTEACYNLAFFLFEYLRRKHAIEVKIIVGWVNDGQWDGATSHAWVEYEGKKIDISLAKTSHPEEQPPGNLIILDHVVKRGLGSYHYWPTLPEKAATALEEMRATSAELSEVIAHKEKEHQKIFALSIAPDGVAQFYQKAPQNMNYDALARIVG
jgi:hypothetical protein